MAAVEENRQQEFVEHAEEVSQMFRQEADDGRGLTPAEAEARDELVAAWRVADLVARRRPGVLLISSDGEWIPTAYASRT